MDQSQQRQTDISGRHGPAHIAKDDQAQLARQVALVLTRQGPKVHKLAPLWPAIRDMLALGYSLRQIVKTLKEQGADISLSAAVRYRQRLGQSRYPDAPLPPPARLQAAPRPLPPPLPTAKTAHARSSPELSQGLEPIESDILARLNEKEQAKFWSMSPVHQKMFLRRKLEQMTGDR